MGDAEKRDGKTRETKAQAAGWQRLSRSLLVYRGGPGDSGQAWLLTFTDLAALMLTFFVLLFSMSTVDDSDWQNLVDSFSPRLTSLQQVTVALPNSDETADAVERTPGTDLDYLQAILKERMTENPALAGASITREAEQLVVSLPGDLLFAPDSIDLGRVGKDAVFALSGVLRTLRNVVEVAGHADPNPPAARYASNWELSLARAAAIAGVLSDLGYDGSIVARGYGHARFEEVDATLPAVERRARARRVDIIIHSYAAEAR
jgi:chemotaxis protein MotB